jgi:hypothetical protein
LLRLLWVIGTMFLIFYAVSAMSTFVSAFDRRLTPLLDRMADRMEGQAPAEDHVFTDAFERLEKSVRGLLFGRNPTINSIELKTFLALSRTAESLVMSLDNEILPPKLVSNAFRP